jgi:hypothetical protein
MCHEGGGAKNHLATAVRPGSFCVAFGEGLLLGQKQMILPRESESVAEMLIRKASQELGAVEGIDLLKLLACVKQLRKLVSGVLNLAQYIFAGFLRVQYEDNEEIVFWPHSIMGVHKVTDELAGVETARRVGTRLGARVQQDMETRLVGAINDGRFLSLPVEKVPAVSAPGGISLQRSTPTRPAPVVAGSLTEVLVNSEEATGILSVRTEGTVRKSPFPGVSQVPEKAWEPEAVFRVQQTHDFGTVS